MQRGGAESSKRFNGCDVLPVPLVKFPIHQGFKMRKQLIAAASAALLATVATTSAHAYVVVSLQVGATTVSCDTSVGCNTGGFFATAGSETVIFSGSVGGYAVSVASTASTAPGNSVLGEVNSSFTAVKNVSAGALDLIYTATGYGFTMPTGPAMTLFGSQSSSSNLNLGGENMTSLFQASNVAAPGFAAAATTSCTMAITTNNSCAGAMTGWTRNASFFSLRDTVTFDLVQNANSSTNGSSNVVAQAVPEPVSTALVGMGLVGMAFFSRRRPGKAA